MKNKKYLNPATFWDADFDTLDLEKDKYFIISRIAERGTDVEVYFMQLYYSKEDILYVVNRHKEISNKTKNYFNTVL